MPVEDLTRQWLCDRTNFFIKTTSNSGITWGTNNYPANSLPSWFAGGNEGSYATLVPASFQAGDADASQAIDVLNYFVNSMGNIRRTRIVIYQSDYRYAGGLHALSDNTAVANTAYPVGDFSSGVAKPAVGDQVIMSQNAIDGTIGNLINAYNSACRNSLLTLTNTICHVSCHSNCHSNRGRR